MGAISGGADKRRAAAWKRIGHYMGMVFQLSDDCMDFESSKDEAKKPVQTDFENGVITYPVIRAFEQYPEARKRAEEGKLTRQELNDCVKQAQGISLTRMLIARYTKKAEKEMTDLGLSEKDRQWLVDIFRKMTDRKN